MSNNAAEIIASLAEDRRARLIGITGAVAVGKSTLARRVADLVEAEVVSTDGFLLSNSALAEAGLSHRKGFPESFDANALAAFLVTWRQAGAAQVPVYSHLHYDVVGTAAVGGADRLVVEGLHLGHPALGLGDQFDLLVHLDAATDDLARWYLGRFQELRTAAAADPTAFLYPYREMAPEVLDAMAMDVWRTVNVVVIEEEVRPHASAAHLVVHLDADHAVLE